MMLVVPIEIDSRFGEDAFVDVIASGNPRTTQQRDVVRNEPSEGHRPCGSPESLLDEVRLFAGIVWE